MTLYALLFGLSGEEFLELTPSTSNNAAYSCGASKSIKIVSDAKTGFYHTTGPSSFPTINTAPWLEQKADVLGRATPQGVIAIDCLIMTLTHTLPEIGSLLRTFIDSNFRSARNFSVKI